MEPEGGIGHETDFFQGYLWIDIRKTRQCYRPFHSLSGDRVSFDDHLCNVFFDST